jgi:hypothetical protein
MYEKFNTLLHIASIYLIKRVGHVEHIGEQEVHTSCLENFKGRDHLGEIGVIRLVISKFVLEQ